MIKNNPIKTVLFVITYWVVYFFIFRSMMRDWWNYLEFLLRNETPSKKFNYESKRSFLTGFAKETSFAGFLFILFCLSLLLFLSAIENLINKY